VEREIQQTQRRLSSLSIETSSGDSTVRFFLDPVAFLHSISWPVVEGDRLKAVRQNLLTVMQLNRQTWTLIRAETDNDREWIPNPVQTGPFAGLEVTDQVIDDWLKTVDAATAVLEGKLLVPSLRFDGGINLKRFFEEAESFDLVLFLTGQNAAGFVEKGPVWDQSFMRALNGPLNRNFGAYMLWFN
jgi:hypothetical protein